MKLSAKEARETVDKMVAACPDLGNFPAEELSSLVEAIITKVGGALNEMEKDISIEGGSMPFSVMVGYMGFGAANAVLGQLPEGSDQRKLFEAGRAVGELMAKKWAEKIFEILGKETLQ